MKERIAYIDYIKAIAIFLVVMGHTISLLWGTENGSDEIIYRIIYSFHMPLFMFVSGLCAYKSDVNWNCKSWFFAVRKKSKQLLWPYIIWGVVTTTLVGSNFIDGALRVTHGGAWFLLCLFEIFVVFYTIELIISKFKINTLCPKLIVYFTIAAILHVVMLKLSSSSFGLWLNLDMLGIHYKYFILGVITSQFQHIQKIARSSIAYFIAMVLFPVMISVEYGSCSYMNVATLTLTAVCGITIIYNFVQTLILPGVVDKLLSYVGRNTLPIYLMHYVLFTGIASLSAQVVELKESILLVLLLSFAISALNIVVCLTINRLIETNKYLTLLLYGK